MLFLTSSLSVSASLAVICYMGCLLVATPASLGLAADGLLLAASAFSICLDCVR